MVRTPGVRSDRTEVQLERCESGRIGLTANELTWETGSEGSNPSLSAHRGRPRDKASCKPGKWSDLSLLDPVCSGQCVQASAPRATGGAVGETTPPAGSIVTANPPKCAVGSMVNATSFGWFPRRLTEIIVPPF